jgi:ABC-type proline/glycine betaine transport system ATPase subunit
MAYTSGTAADRLAAVREAIDRCLTAEAYTVRGREKRSASLMALMKLEEKLIEQVNAESNGGQMGRVARFVSPR